MSCVTIYSIFAIFCLGLAIDSSPVPQPCSKRPFLAGAPTDLNGKLIAALPLKSSGIVPIGGSAGLNGQLNVNLPVKNPVDDLNGKLTATLPLKGSGSVPIGASAGLNGHATAALPTKGSGIVPIVAAASLNGHLATNLPPKNTGIVPPNLQQAPQIAPLKQSASHNGNGGDEKDGKKEGEQTIKEDDKNGKKGGAQTKKESGNNKA